MTDKEFVEERVAFTTDAKVPDKFIPRISVSKTLDRGGRAKVEKSFRPFETTDMTRILDYEHVPDPPPDGPMMHCENEMEFPSRHFSLRGGFLFYFDLGDVSGTGQSHYVTYHGPPIGVIPLNSVRVQFPPGGRRVFREHAQTNARTGYELAILHEPKDDSTPRPPAFVVAESLGQREKWAGAIRARAEIDDHTKLRAISSFAQDVLTKPAELLRQKEDRKKEAAAALESASGVKDAKKANRKGKRGATGGAKDGKGVGEESLVQEALHEFGKSNFVEKAWIDNYFESHSEMDAASRCKLMEKQQEAIKRGLKSAVLEQYEYFVEASGEMTKMGREVVDLKTLVETQVETIKEMKEIDFSSAILDPVDENGSENGDLFKERKSRRNRFADDASDVSSVSSDGDGGMKSDRGLGLSSNLRAAALLEKITIEIPKHLEDVSDEILAYAKESRYTDATDLWEKTKQEVSDIIHKHEEPTDNQLTKKQQNQMQILTERLDELAEMISKRLVENLRRKNEALKQAAKRERADPSAHLIPSVSPCCLNDDSISLRLLVRLGKSQEAATAYAARRSLLLLESLHERPLTGTGNVDLVIYAAQLSQSFFSCLAGAIEGFLDLFTTLEKPGDEMSLDQSSINSHGSGLRNLPAGALASIVLWCDGELAKFAAAFGGTRVLGNLALSPPPRDASFKKGPRVVGQSSDTSGSKDRQNAIEVAAQCVGQAFQYASENLDAVGLPLSPRLAESLRKKLKGCEAEVARLLDDQWSPIVMDWEMNLNDEDSPLDER